MKVLLTTFCLQLVLSSVSLIPQQPSTVSKELYSALAWRCIGPHRGGRVLAVSGVRGQPNTFYFGSVVGGVWKTEDAGRTWRSIFDDQPVASIGALAVSPSDPNIIYVGTGEADMRSDISFGQGMYKSNDAGKTWVSLGLTDTQQIGRILIDPKNPDVVLVAALGHGFGPNAERGVFRSTDGGKSWKKVLYKDENTGAIDLAYDPDNAQTVFATLWNGRRLPWSSYAPVTGPGGGIFKSIDGGESWKQLRGAGLPEGKIGRTGIDVGAGTHGQRVYALIDAERSSGLYVSQDGGQSWSIANRDPRLLSRGWYFGEVRSDPKNSNTVYVSNVSLHRSLDGGKTFKTIRGAPGGDDYHSLWIDPDEPQRMISGVDQGTLVTVNGGKTWSSWYNQPTAQFYHVAVDNQFPYFVYGAQQDSGTAAVASRSDYGQITFRDWYPVGAGESGFILPDPANPQVVYGGSTSGEMYRFNKRTGQVIDVSPTPASLGMNTRHRYPWTTPIAFSSRPPYVLYQASQFLFKTVDQGHSWTVISPDLTLRRGDKESEARGVIYTIAPSPISAGMIWIGTDNGLIHLTRDEGKTWNNVSPPDLAPWSMMSIIEASPHDSSTAYVAVDRHQMDDLTPYIYRTRDFGKTWIRINSGIAHNAYVHVVREDPVRKGLLFAGTELGVYFSMNDGDSWQSLQLNLPVTSVRDLVVKDNDLAVATHGRSFWILDDFTPLRQLAAPFNEAPALYTPAVALRLRKNESRDTPLPPETPAGQNPPAGAIIYYNLKATTQSEIKLEILDGAGRLIKKFSSNDRPRAVEDNQPFPTYWLHPAAPLTTKPGLNRLVWDMRYERPAAARYFYSIAAVYGEDAIMLPEGPLALPGTYQVKLTTGGQSYSAPLRIREDPRVTLAPDALEQQLALELKIISLMDQSYEAIQQLQTLRGQLKELQTRLSVRPDLKDISATVSALDARAQTLIGGPPQFPPSAELSLSALNNALGSLLIAIDSADSAPTTQAANTFSSYQQLLEKQFASWTMFKEKDIGALNVMLSQHQLPVVKP